MIKQIFTGFICLITIHGYKASQLLAGENTLHDINSSAQSNLLIHAKFNTSAASFVENKGQIKGTDGTFQPEVKFALITGNVQIFLLENGIAYQFSRMHFPKGYQELLSIPEKEGAWEKRSELQKQIRVETFRMDMVLAGSNKQSVVTTEGPSTDYTNFYNHNVMAVHSYSKIVYHEIYPGIDWVIYARHNEIKYDFVLQPGADPSLIQMQYLHHQESGLNKNGSFTFKNLLGQITENAPSSFQEAQPVRSAFTYKNNVLKFKLGKYDINKSLRIDPALVWATYYGGTNDDYGYSCNTDLSGNVYLSGYTYSSGGISAGGHQNTYVSPGQDAFLVKFNSNGVRQWATYYGGVGNDVGYSNVCDASGNVYLFGSTESTGNISSGGHQNTFGGGVTDAFLVKFNSSGVRQWATYYGGSGNENLSYSNSVDALGNIYLSGITLSTNNISSGGFQNASGGGSDAFLVKFNTSGIRQWATYYGGAGSEYAYSNSTDANGNVYLAGVTSSTSNISSGGFQNSNGGGWDAFLVKFNSSGVRQWGTFYGDVNPDYGWCCTTDLLNNVYLTGYTSSSSNIASGGFQNIFGGGSSTDAFLVKFNSAGVRLWATYYGDVSNDVGLSCKTDMNNNIYMSGYTSSTVNIASGGVQNVNSGSLDALIVKFNSSGARLWASYFGGPLNDLSYGCAVDASGDVYIGGQTSSTLGIASGGHQNSYGGGVYDGFIAKLCNPPEQAISISGNTMACNGSSQNYSVAPINYASGYIWAMPGGWSGSSLTNTISVVPNVSGQISITPTNACGSGPVQNLSVTIAPIPTISVNSGSICSGQSFTLFPTGAGTYTFQGGSAIVSPGVNSSYSVIGTSSAGCIASNTAVASISVFPLPVISVNSGTVCFGQTFTMSPSGALSYSFSNGSATVSPQVNSSYSVIGTSSAGCVSTISAVSNITVYPNPIVSVNSGSICYGQSFTITPSGAASYSVSGGNIVVSPPAISAYSISGTSSLGCVSSNTVVCNVVVNALPTVVVNSGIICAGQTFSILASGALTYTYSSGTPVVSPTVNTSYSVSGTNSLGCVTSAPAISNITVNPAPVISVNNGTICSGSSFTITPSGANTYTFLNGSAIVSPTVTSSYSVSGTNTLGCVSLLPGVSIVTVFPLPLVTAYASNTQVCTGQSVTLTGGGANSYTWTNGILNGIPFSPTAGAVYTVSGTDLNSCVNSTTISIMLMPLPTLSLTATPTILCAGETCSIIASGANSYTWNTNQNGPLLQVTPTLTTTYSVTGSNGCTSTASITLNVSICEGLSESAGDLSVFNLYPNPNTGLFSIEIYETAHLRILNSLSQIISIKTCEAGKHLFDIQNVENGLYFIQVITNHDTHNYKMIKE